MGNAIKTVLNGMAKKAILFGIIALLVVVGLAASEYYLDTKDTKEDSNNPKNGPAAARSFITDVTIDDDGNIKLNKTYDEWWDELKEQGNDLTKYLSNAKELAKLVNAQLATEYLDTRPGEGDSGYDKNKWEKNINKDIDWNDVNKNSSDRVQGIIKLNRKDSDGNEYYMTYVSPEKFNNLVSSGSSDALKHFTIEKQDNQNTSSSSLSETSSGLVTGQDIINEAEKYVGVLPYVYGGKSLTDGADCSGFVWAVLKKTGAYTGEYKTSQGFESIGTEVPSINQAQAGDVLCYGGHVAFYDGNGGRIHAPGRGQMVSHASGTNADNIVTIRRFVSNTGSSSNDTVLGGAAQSSYLYTAKIAVPSSSGMTTQQVDYKKYVDKYTMPFNYLYTMLLIGEDKDFAFDLAELVYGSAFEITVHDSLTITTIEETYQYQKRKVIPGETEDDPIRVVFETITEPSTTVQKNYTSEAALTKANAWYINYEQEYEYSDLPEQTYDTGWQELGGNTTEIRGRKKKTVTKIKTYKYTSKPATYKEKTDKKSDEPNFVTVFLDNYNARSNILSVTDWLFEALENNENTKDMVDLTKYLIYKATERDYGVTDFDSIWSAFNKNEFNSINGIYGGTVEEKVWFVFKDMGVSDVAAAAAMGNLSYESGGHTTNSIRTNTIEGGYNEYNGGIGMCQWTNSPRNSGRGRNAQLHAYAQSKGKDWRDADIQIEFLIGELLRKGDATQFTSSQFMTKTYAGVTYPATSWQNVGEDASQIDYATRAFAATFERPGEKYFVSSMNERISAARYFYNAFKGRQRGTGTLDTTSAGSGVRGHVVLPNGKMVTVFNQTAISGWGGKCNRAAGAIIASMYAPTENRATADADIVRDMNDYYKIYGPSYFGAVPPERFFNKYGLKITSAQSGAPISNYQTQLREQLKSGGYAMLWLANPPGAGSNGGNTYRGKSGTTWTSQYHWIPVLGYNSSNDKMYIADWGRADWYDIDEFTIHGVTYMVFISEK